jgi:hypothetical protein
MSKDTKYIVAGNWNEFTNYTRNRVNDDTMYIYVSGINIIRGLSDISGVFIGTFHLRPDLEEIKSQIQIIKSRKRGFTAQTIQGLDPRLVTYDDILKEEILKERIELINQLIPSEFIWKAIS